MVCTHVHVHLHLCLQAMQLESDAVVVGNQVLVLDDQTISLTLQLSHPCHTHNNMVNNNNTVNNNNIVNNNMVKKVK